MPTRAMVWVLAAAGVVASAAVAVEMPYRTVDGMELKLDLAVPEGGPGPYPVVICLHGGGWSMGSKGSFRKYLPQFAELGYAAAAIQYRLAPGHRFPAPIEDTYAAIRYLRANAARWNLDPRRVYLLGASAGAHLALLAGWAHRDEIGAVIDLSGPTDLRDWRMGPVAEATLVKTTGKTSAMLVAELLGETKPEAASPVVQMGRGAKPVLILQWRQDNAVAAEQVERLVAALQRHGVRHELTWLEGRGHALAGPGVERIVPQVVEFLNSVRPQ